MKVQFIFDISPDDVARLRRAKKGGTEELRNTMADVFNDMTADDAVMDQAIAAFGSNI